MNLVTGATGIVGSHVVLELLLRNQPVTASRRKHSDVKAVEKLFSYYSSDHRQLFEKIKWVEVDVLDLFSVEAALEGVTTVYHCAGLVSFNKKDKKNLGDVNEKGTANVVNACLSKKTVLCHVSSISTINNSDYLLPLSEDVFWKTSGRESDYAISKYNGEREVWRGIEEGLDAVIVNPGVILSPGFWQQSSSRLFGLCYRGNRFYTPGTTGFVGAGDLAKIMVELVSKRLLANRYIVVENNYTYRHIFSEIQGRFKKPAPRFLVPLTLLQLLKIGDAFISFFSGRAPRITKPLIHAAFNTQLFSNSKIKKTLDFDFIPADRLIQQICKSYLFEKT